MMHISSQENDFCGLCSSAKQYPVNCRPEECPTELAALAQLSQQRSTQPDRSMELQPSPDRISGVQMTRTAKSNSKRPKGKHPCQLWEVKGEQACKGFHWYNQAAACNRHMTLCHSSELLDGTIQLYMPGKQQKESGSRRGANSSSGDRESKAEESDDESEGSEGYGQDGLWEVKELVDRKCKKTTGSRRMYEYLVLWVTKGDEVDHIQAGSLGRV